MRRIAVHWLSAFLAVLVTAGFIPIFTAKPNWEQAAVFAAILALLNVFVRPLISLVTCPINLLTLGLFTLVINAFTFWLAAYVYRGLEVQGFVAAFMGALLVSVISFVVDRLLAEK